MRGRIVILDTYPTRFELNSGNMWRVRGISVRNDDDVTESCKRVTYDRDGRLDMDV